MDLATVRKILDVATVLILAAGLFVLGLAFGLSPRRPTPDPAPYVAPYIVPSPAPAPSLKCFDVICPYCHKRFTVDPNPNSTGAKKDSFGKAYAKPVSDAREFRPKPPRTRCYFQLLTDLNAIRYTTIY